MNAYGLNIRTLQVNPNNLVKGQRYIVTRRNPDGNVVTLNGTFSSLIPTGNIIFDNVDEEGIRISFPMALLISVHVAVSDLPGTVMKRVNDFIGGKSRRKRKSTRRNSLSGSRTRVSRVKGEHHNR